MMWFYTRLHWEDHAADPILPASQRPMGHLHVAAQPNHRPRPAAGVRCGERARRGARAQDTPPQGARRQIHSRCRSPAEIHLSFVPQNRNCFF